MTNRIPRTNIILTSFNVLFIILNLFTWLYLTNDIITNFSATKLESLFNLQKQNDTVTKLVPSQVDLQEPSEVLEQTNLRGSVSKDTKNSSSCVTCEEGLNMPARMKRYQYAAPEPRTQQNSSICGTAPDYNDYFALSSKERSDNEEDKTIYELFFKDREAFKGTYVELGAFDGIKETNSRFFDECLGWEGLLVEPNPSIYGRLQGNRKHAHRMSFASSCSTAQEAMNKTVEFHPNPFTNAGQKGYALAYEKGKSTQVPCGSLTPVLLDLFPRGRISFFSLDVEGAEPLVIENIDFNKVFIEVLIAENRNAFCKEVCETRDRARLLMVNAGYKRYSSLVRKSDLYVHSMSEFQLSDDVSFE